MARAKDFIHQIIPAHLEQPNQRILIVSHGGFIMEFLNVVRGIAGKPPVYANVSKNTAVYVLRFTSRNGKLNANIVMGNSVTHLEEVKGTTKK
jgi:broad specificity phosphatase PhoE